MNYNERIDNIISQLEQLKNHNEEADRLITQLSQHKLVNNA